MTGNLASKNIPHQGQWISPLLVNLEESGVHNTLQALVHQAQAQKFIIFQIRGDFKSQLSRKGCQPNHLDCNEIGRCRKIGRVECWEVEHQECRRMPRWGLKGKGKGEVKMQS